MMLAGGVDPRGPSDAAHHPQAHGGEDTEVHGVPRQPEYLAAAHKQRAGTRPRLLHVPSEHEPYDEPSRLPSSSR